MNFSRWDCKFSKATKQGLIRVDDTIQWPSSVEQDERDRWEFLFWVECRWIVDSRPYYRVYPSIEGLLKTASLEIPGSHIKFPIETVSIEFSDTGSLSDCCAIFSAASYEHGTGYGLNCVIQRGIKYNMFNIPLDDRTVEEILLKHVVQDDYVFDVLKVFIGACMFSDDPLLIEPIVLNRDAIKYKTATLEQRQVIEDRAARLNGRGWAIGKGFEERCETSPHFRKSHLALFWTGKGREIPRLQLRKGCLVKPRKLTEIPTGYYDEEG